MLKARLKALKVQTLFEVGSKNKMNFWKDRCCRDSSLKDVFPDLYAIAFSKEVWVIDVWEGGNWNPRFL